MRTSKIITAIAALNLILFMSTSSIANPGTICTGDIIKSGVKNQITTAETAISKIAAVAETEFNYLRFDVNKFADENAIAELPAYSTGYLRFDVNHFINENETGITELPDASEFNYLLFEVNNFSESMSAEITELPASEFDYLRFDVNNFAGSTAGEINELPVQ